MCTQEALVVDVEPVASSNAVRGHLERPIAETPIGDGGLLLIALALGTEHQVTAIELVRDDRVFERIALDQARPDLVAAFPDRPTAGMSGLRAVVDVRTIGDDEILVQAALDGGGSAPLAKLRLRGSPLIEPTTQMCGPVAQNDLSAGEGTRVHRIEQTQVANSMTAVARDISPNDMMAKEERLEQYLTWGRSAVHCIRAALKMVEVPDPRRILDLPSGHGRGRRTPGLA